jgi:hypothetical protein
MTMMMKCLGNMGSGVVAQQKIQKGNNALSTLVLFFSFVRGV